MMKDYLHRTRAICAVGAIVFLATACGTTSNSNTGSSTTASGVKVGPGVDAATKTITIGNIAALSGPAAALGVPALAGSETAVKAINAAGGVDGWKLELWSTMPGMSPRTRSPPSTGWSLSRNGSDLRQPDDAGHPAGGQGRPCPRQPLLWDSAWITSPTSPLSERRTPTTSPTVLTILSRSSTWARRSGSSTRTMRTVPTACGASRWQLGSTA